MELLEKAQRLLEAQPLCDHCLGRQFALLGYGLDDSERGEALKLMLTMKNHQLALAGKKEGFSTLRLLVSRGSFEMAAELLKKMRKRAKKKEPCYLCQGLFESSNILVENALEALKAYEYNTFLVGVELPNIIEEREDEFKALHDVAYGESMRNEFSRHIGKKLSKVTQKLAEFKKPDVVVLVRPFTGEVIIQSNPLYVKGSYKKLVRDIPQSKWFCRQCHGEGCKNCKGTGKMYSESVEEIIAAPLLKKTEGDAVAFHAAGREDVDARMLGMGRPFIMEIKRPQKRFINLKELEKIINEHGEGKVEILNLVSATKADIKRLKKGEGSTKVYKVFIDFDRDVSDEELLSVTEKLSKSVVQQRTPLRVLHRRADLVREKYIYEAYLKRLAPNRAEMKIRCQGGLYIKELVSGDEGRTVPSVASIINAQAKPVDLDVLNVIMEES
ncbi:MAG: tRNA pseudouridine(54/55) synthase Pus10 [Candidatus Bathyarchaeota archaeon]|nr:tRNA pseudouridine(54/55) synthase Pus10 [Candidatus Bathyarchaeum tardum]WGM89652.1 MAG: tRNA pseudouridine(54/55) synthase Pus10 [Candidatus Bathyarchaeum tardum]WNZ30246.1 MAG: tRNA pseudouridine(54/55) synthase Pus10 [Candidatus Bathyarchaeota archaeon]